MSNSYFSIYTSSGDLAFKFFDFPDGQPHFELLVYEVEFRQVTIEAAIRNPNELFRVLLAIDVLRRKGYEVSLDIRYLMGARMDRAITLQQPFTLDIVARLLNGAGLSKVRIFDPHSRVATDLLNAYAVMPQRVVASVLATVGDVEIIIPDGGATSRVWHLAGGYLASHNRPAVQCYKERDPLTGRITGMRIGNSSQVSGRPCLIIDDICDGGATFKILAAKLREAGATNVYLYVTHGIFSGVLPLEGIDRIFTTDSYKNWSIVPHIPVSCVPIRMRDLT